MGFRGAGPVRGHPAVGRQRLRQGDRGGQQRVQLRRRRAARTRSSPTCTLVNTDQAGGTRPRRSTCAAAPTPRSTTASSWAGRTAACASRVPRPCSGRVHGDPGVYCSPAAVDGSEHGPVGLTARTFSNPAGRNARLALALPSAGRTQVSLFDATGRLVQTVLDAPLTAGSHDIPVDLERCRQRHLLLPGGDARWRRLRQSLCHQLAGTHLLDGGERAVSAPSPPVPGEACACPAQFEEPPTMRSPAARNLLAVLASLFGIAAAVGAGASPVAHLRGQVMGTDGEPLPYANVELYRIVSPGDTLGFRSTCTSTRAPDGVFDSRSSPASTASGRPTSPAGRSPSRASRSRPAPRDRWN